MRYTHDSLCIIAVMIIIALGVMFLLTSMLHGMTMSTIKELYGLGVMS